MSCLRPLVLLVCLAVWCGHAAAQQSPSPRRIGILIPTLGLNMNRVTPFRDGMRDLGWVEGRDYVAFQREHGFGAGEFAAAALRLATERVEVVVLGTLEAALAVHAWAPKLPIVILATADPVASGAAESLARPGGMITGMTLMSPELLSKRVGFLKEMVPRLSRLAVVMNPRTPAAPLMAQATVQAAERLGVMARPFEVRAPGDIEGAFDVAAAWSADAVILVEDAFLFLVRAQLMAAAGRRHLPLVCPFAQMTRQGCLFSYGVDMAHQLRRAAPFVDKILRGEKPGNLPFEQPTRFSLAINLRVAAAIGLDVPPLLLSVADEVIE